LVSLLTIFFLSFWLFLFFNQSLSLSISLCLVFPAKISQTQQTIHSRQSSQQRKREEGKGGARRRRWRSRLVAKRRVQVLNGSKNLDSGPQRVLRT
jgi:hypothetical protein